MRGDFSRIAFNRLMGYTAVLEQQGRVALDADANEQCFIDEYLRGSELVDVVGDYGAPAADAGFQITVSGREIQIGAGRYYVGGLMCENPAAISYDLQPYLLAANPSGTELLSELAAAPAGAAVQVYLQAWQRLVTALDDPCLREPALGQADTTARLQTVWRVVASLENQVPTPAPPLPVGLPPGMAPCCQVMYKQLTLLDNGTMNARVSGSSGECGCQPIPAAGYQGVENQLYRVEIHQGGDETTATFKWSRENGSVVAAVTGISGSTVTVNSIGPDANLGFQNLEWVELSDDNDLFGENPNQPGSLYQIQSMDPPVTLGGTVTPVDPAQHARLRRWDQSGPTATANGIPLSAGTWIPLENGIEVCFGAGQYRPGDFWTIPARTATGTIEWPPCGSDAPAVPATSVKIHTAPLACIHWEAGIRPPVRIARASAAAANVEPVAAVQAQRAPAATGAQSAGAGATGATAATAGAAGATAATAATGSQQLSLSEVRSLSDAQLLLLGHYTWDDCRLVFNPLAELAAPATPAAIHVASVSWANDDVTTLDQLIGSGLTVGLDAAPASPVNSANFIVTVEAATPDPKEQATEFPAAAVNLKPSTLLRTITVVDSQVTVAGQTLTWELPYVADSAFQNLTLQELEAMILPGALVGWFARARVKLLGEAIFGNGTAGTIYLDGRAFGQSALRADGTTPRIALNLPSGDGSAASDLQGWFYLAPTLRIQFLTVADAALTVVLNAQGQVTGVETTAAAGTAAQPVTPTASILLNYPPIATGNVSLALTGATGVGTAASVPATVPIVVGERSITVPISVLSNPGAGQTLTFDLAATLTPAAGPISSASASFTLTGAAVP